LNVRSCRVAGLTVLSALAFLVSPLAAQKTAVAPKLAVVVSVDGLPWDRLQYYRPWYVAGLKRLLEESRLEANARYRHLNTETGPGHSSLSTGAPPRVTGVVANRWFEVGPDASIRSLNCVDQTLPSAKTAPGPWALRVPTLGDRLAEAKPGARVVSLSAKDRSAIFMAGRHETHAVYWYDQDSGRFVSSPFYAPPAAAKAIVDRFNRAQAGALLPARFGLAWKRLPPPEPPSILPLARPAPAPDMLDYQLPSNGLGWDHPLTTNPRGYFSALYYSPLTDELLADLALAFLESEAFGLGRREQPDLLWLSFSAQDVVSHSYGVESEENLDVLRRLDLQLGRLLGTLDRRHPEGSVVLALSADHGMPPIPEAERRRNPGFRGGRLLTTDRGYPTFLERLNRLLALELCLDPTSRVIFGSEGFNLTYNRPAFPFRTLEGSCGPAGRAATSKDVDRVLPALMTRVYAEEVEKVYLASERDRWPKDDPVTEFVVNDFDPERSGDAVFVPRYGVMTHWDPARGAMHGSHYDYDTHVPLLFWGGPFRAETVSAPSTPYDLAPTLGALLGVELKDAVGRSRLR
jgi:predicted AlkP superfamily pyrophosphatase or phosphodiesterase